MNVTVPGGPRDRGGYRNSGGDINEEHLPERDVWSYLHVSSFLHLKRRPNSAF